MPGSFDPREYGFDDSWCRSRRAAEQEQGRANYLVMGSKQMHLSMCREVSGKAKALGARIDFAKNDAGELVIYEGDARKVSGEKGRGQVALKPLMEFYRVKFGPFRKLYMEASDMDGEAIRFTPTGERE